MPAFSRRVKTAALYVMANKTHGRKYLLRNEEAKQGGGRSGWYYFADYCQCGCGAKVYLDEYKAYQFFQEARIYLEEKRSLLGRIMRLIPRVKFTVGESSARS